MAISQSQEMSMVNARSARSKQDAKHPFLINVKDARLMPNTPLLRKNSDYRVFTGDIRANLQERLKFIGSAHGTAIPEAAPFDVGSATKEELVEFAANEYGEQLSVDTDIRTLRKQVLSLSEAQ